MNQKTKVNDYILIDNYLSVKECDHLIRLYKTKKFVPHGWYNVETDTARNDPTDCSVADTDINFLDVLSPAIEKALRDYSNKISKERLYSKMSKPRLNKYGEGKDMKEHYDHIHSLFDGTDKGIPILSIVGLLNDNFTGGGFCVNGKDMKLKKGDIIIFPSNFLYRHEVKTIKKGERYSYVSWAF